MEPGVDPCDRLPPAPKVCTAFFGGATQRPHGQVIWRARGACPFIQRGYRGLGSCQRAICSRMISSVRRVRQEDRMKFRLERRLRQGQPLANRSLANRRRSTGITEVAMLPPAGRQLHARGRHNPRYYQRQHRRPLLVREAASEDRLSVSLREQVPAWGPVYRHLSVGFRSALPAYSCGLISSWLGALPRQCTGTLVLVAITALGRVEQEGWTASI